MSKKTFSIPVFFTFVCLIAIFLTLTESCKSSRSASKTPHKKPHTLPANKEPETVIAPKKNAFADGDSVRKIQVLLYLAGFDPGRADGIFKEQTSAALDEFQKSAQINVGDRSDTTLHRLGLTLMDFDVKDMQTALAQKGYDPGPADNLIGPMTRNAYLDFLEENDLAAVSFTKEIKDALFSDNPQYNKPINTDPLFNERQTIGSTFISGQNIRIANATLADIQQALKIRGYDPGPPANSMTPQLSDALYLFQNEKKLPMGGLNYDTMRALGFKD